MEKNSKEIVTVDLVVEIYPNPEFGDSYGEAQVMVEVEKQLYDQMSSKTNYDNLLEFILNALENNFSKIISRFDIFDELSDLKADDYNWLNMDPCIKVKKIGSIDIEVIYDCEEEDKVTVAKLLDRPVGEVFDWCSDFKNDVRFSFNEEQFQAALNA